MRVSELRPTASLVFPARPRPPRRSGDVSYRLDEEQ